MVAADAVEAIAVEAFRQCEWRRKVDVMAAQARCPQWWGVFSVRGKSGTYEVYSDHVLRGTWRCGCGAFIFDGHGARCKHIKRVLRHGCLAGPGLIAGRNDLGGSVGVSITYEPNPVRRATECTERPCVWRDDAGSAAADGRRRGPPDRRGAVRRRRRAVRLCVGRPARAERRRTCARPSTGRTAGDRGGLGKRLRGRVDGHRRESDALTLGFSESRPRVSNRRDLAAIGDCDPGAGDPLRQAWRLLPSPRCCERSNGCPR